MENTQYTLDPLEQSILDEIRGDVINTDDNKPASTDTNRNDRYDYDIDAALREELELNQQKEQEQERQQQEEEQVDTSKQSDDNTDNDDNEPFSLALDIMREEGMIYIPEDFDGEIDTETFDYFKQETLKMRDMQIIQDRRNQFLDNPEELRLFDYFFTADEHADLPTFQKINKDLTSWENYDLTSEDNQKAIIKAYFLDAINPNSPSYEFIIKDIDNKVDEVLTNYEGEDKAKEARQYFLAKSQEVMAEEVQRVETLKEQKAEQERQLELQRMQWNQDFQQSVANSQWSVPKKRALIQEQYAEVQLGESHVPVWYAKETLIKQNPELYMQYLDWLTNFDLSTGKFKKTDTPSTQKTQVSRKIEELIRKKQGVNKSQHVDVRRDNDDKVIVNPLENI